MGAREVLSVGCPAPSQAGTDAVAAEMFGRPCQQEHREQQADSRFREAGILFERQVALRPA